MANTTLLIQELRTVVAQINAQMAAIERKVKADSPSLTTPFEATYTDGKFVLAEMLAAKAHALSGIAILQASLAKSR